MAGGELRLDVTAGKAAGFSFVVDDRLVIGRNSEGPGRLADDPELSRHHAEIARTANGEFTIRDLSSTNGTHLNGTRLESPTVLAVGDRVEVGATTLTVCTVPVLAPPPEADVDVRAATVVGEVAAPAPVATGPPLEVRLRVDFAQESAELAVDGSGQPIRLRLDNGRWSLEGGGG